jgi:hypothetical protein
MFNLTRRLLHTKLPYQLLNRHITNRLSNRISNANSIFQKKILHKIEILETKTETIMKEFEEFKKNINQINHANLHIQKDNSTNSNKTIDKKVSNEASNTSSVFGTVLLIIDIILNTCILSIMVYALMLCSDDAKKITDF